MMDRKCPYAAWQAGSSRGAAGSEAIEAWPIAFLLVKSKPLDPAPALGRTGPRALATAAGGKSSLAVQGVRDAPFFNPAASRPGPALLRAGPVAAGHLLRPAGAPRGRPAGGDRSRGRAAQAELGRTLELGRRRWRRPLQPRPQGW